MRPQVVAHRGASHDDAEHTLGAYLKALDQGADALECDVRLTADGHLVCVHDRDLRRTANHTGLVSAMTLEEFDGLDFAAWKNPWGEREPEPEPTADPEHRSLLTLRRLLETVRDHDRRVEIAIETKHPTRYAGLVERRLVEQLRDLGWAGARSPVRVMSFSYAALVRTRRLAPELPLVMLIEHPERWPVLRRIIGDDWLLGPGVEQLRDNPRFARRMRESGRELHVWTVNTPEDLQVCLDNGVRAVITDRPGYLRGLLDG